jgi:hypothetical protein
MLRDPYEERFMPSILILNIKDLVYKARLTWGDWNRHDQVGFKDTEVSMIMEQYPPLPIIMVKMGWKRFTPTDQEHWEDLVAGGNNVFEQENGQVYEHTPCLPFYFKSETADYGTQRKVVWFTRLEDDSIVECKVHLSHSDPSYWTGDVKRAVNGTIIKAKYQFHPQIGGTYSTISWWTEGNTGGSVTVYWPWPDKFHHQTWGDVIDFTARNEARE